MQDWWKKLQMQVQVHMLNNVELSRTSVIHGAKAWVEIKNQHKKMWRHTHIHTLYFTKWNDMLAHLQTYLDPHPHTHVHFTHTLTFASPNYTFVDRTTHLHTNTHRCKNTTHLHMWISNFYELFITPLSSWLS